MIIIGSRSRNNVMGQLQYPCPQCRQNSFHTIVRSKRWFTLFFIPVFPFSKQTISRCNICGFQTAIDNNEADARMAQMPPPQYQQPQFPPR